MTYKAIGRENGVLSEQSFLTNINIDEQYCGTCESTQLVHRLKQVTDESERDHAGSNRGKSTRHILQSDSLMTLELA